MSKFAKQVKDEAIEKILNKAENELTTPQYTTEGYWDGGEYHINKSCISSAYWDGVEDGIRIAYEETAIQNLKMTWRPVTTRPKFDGFYLAIIATPSGYFTRRLVKFSKSSKPQWAVPIKMWTYLPAMPDEYS